MNSYTVKITREGISWAGSATEVAATAEARTLIGLEESMRAAIESVVGAEQFEMTFEYTDATVAKAVQLRKARLIIDEKAAQLRVGTENLVPTLPTLGLSVRDIALLLGISNARADQLRQPTKVAKV